MTEGSQQVIGFAGYKRLLLDWHEQDLAAHARIDQKLEQITVTLAEMKVQTAELKVQAGIGRWLASITVPGVVGLLAAIVTTVLLKKLFGL